MQMYVLYGSSAYYSGSTFSSFFTLTRTCVLNSIRVRLLYFSICSMNYPRLSWRANIPTVRAQWLGGLLSDMVHSPTLLQRVLITSLYNVPLSNFWDWKQIVTMNRRNTVLPPCQVLGQTCLKEWRWYSYTTKALGPVKWQGALRNATEMHPEMCSQQSREKWSWTKIGLVKVFKEQVGFGLRTEVQRRLLDAYPTCQGSGSEKLEDRHVIVDRHLSEKLTRPQKRVCSFPTHLSRSVWLRDVWARQ